jgi:hypothetical protein
VVQQYLISWFAAFVLFAAACGGSSRPPTKIPKPELDGQRLVIPSTGNGLADLVLEAVWEVRGDRYCVTDGAVKLLTATGSIPFDDASLCVTMDPVSIVGEAFVTFPAQGFLESVGVTVEGRRASLGLVLGSQLERLEIDGRSIVPNPYHYYIYVHYQDGLEVGIGNATISASESVSATIVLAPQEPLFYVSGAMAAPFFPAGIESAAFGFSPQGRFVFEPARELREGDRKWKPEVVGHMLIAGSVPLTPHPITVSGELVVDVDADDDGRTIFEGDQRDFQLGINGGLAVGYSKAGFDFTFDFASGALVYDARPGAIGSIHFSVGDTGGLFAGTPLSVFEPQTTKGEVHGYFRDLDDFGIYATVETRPLGFAMSKTQISLDTTGIRARGELSLPADIGGVVVEGEINSDGSFALTGTGDLTIAGMNMVSAEVTLGSKGVSIAGKIDLPGVGKALVSGRVQPDGKFALSGTGDLRPAGLKLANAKVSVSPKGASISGRVSFAGTGFNVSGSVSPRKFSLSGKVSLNLVIFKGSASLTIDNRSGARAVVSGKACLPGGACMDLAGFDVDTRGRICPIWPVVGKKCLKILGKKKKK